MNKADFDRYGETFFDELHRGHDFEAIANGFKHYYYDCLPKSKQAPILDVGCGAGHFLAFLEQKGYENAEGLELSSQQAEIARKNVGALIHEGSVSNLLAKRVGFYEMITLNDVLEHIPKNKTVGFLEELRQGLTSNGSLVVNVPQVAGLTTAYNRYNDFTHNIVFTEMSLKQVLLMAGYSNVRFISEKWPFKWTLRHIAYRLARYFWHRFLDFAYFIEMPGERKPHSWQIRLVATAKKRADGNE